MLGICCHMLVRFVAVQRVLRAVINEDIHAKEE